MNMKRIIILVFALISVISATAQSIIVKSFNALPTDVTTLSKEGKRIDQNGDVAALIKVMTNEKGFVFEGGAMGIVDTKQRVGEIWVWVPHGLRKITILHPEYEGIRDYWFPETIEAGRTYELRLKVPSPKKDKPKTPKPATDSLRPKYTDKRVFSVGPNKKVYFSPGNLQYQASTNTWRFAEHQWDCMGTRNRNASSSNAGWIDLFGWGTSGYRHGAMAYQPWSKNSKESDYHVYGFYTNNLNDQTGKADWGYNEIANGSDTENQWRTLTKEEWQYLFNQRFTESGIGYAKGNVAGVNGIILLPDEWLENTFPLNEVNNPNAGYGSNVITASQWETFEKNGAVFLPAAGRRSEYDVAFDNVTGEYWSATAAGASSAHCLEFNLYGIYPNSSEYRSYGRSVRLVQTKIND